jgi:hypothetical protein
MKGCDLPDCPVHLLSDIDDLDDRLKSVEATLMEFTVKFDTMTKMTQFIMVAVCAALGIDVSGGM